MLEADPYAIQKVEAAEAAKSLGRRVAEETIWFTLSFAFMVVMFWMISDTPLNVLAWLREPAGWPDANRIYHPIYEPFKKWMLMLIVFCFFYSCRMIAFWKGR